MELIERIKQIIEFKQISVSAFEKKISASDGVIRRAIRNKTDIYSRFLIEISDKFPDISAEWLLRENGEMLRDGSEKSPIRTENSHDSLAIIELSRQIADLARENGQLQAENEELKKELARIEAEAIAASVRTA